MKKVKPSSVFRFSFCFIDRMWVFIELRIS